MLKITADENIAWAKEAFSEFGEVTLLQGREISPASLKDTDILIVRSITKVDKNLLGESKVRFVGTATIGKDHIDIEYLRNNNITFADAAGCNANAVKEYVFTALVEVLEERKVKFEDLSIGIIGVGNVGSKVAACAESLGMKTILNDPPLKRKTGNEKYRELNEALSADIVTLHVPLNKDGIDKTFHLFDFEKINHLKDHTILVNSSRGSVIDNMALEKVIDKKNLTVILDVWENEPVINSSLLKKVFIGTPHIAGYSYEGKVNGTMMIYTALSKFLNKKESYSIKPAKVDNSVIEIKENVSIENSLLKIFKRIYDIKKDDYNLRKILPEGNGGKYFDSLRKEYHLRYEFSNYTVIVPEKETRLRNILSAFGFRHARF
jgi:erythronate-4-phosphate dehydrogenase